MSQSVMLSPMYGNHLKPCPQFHQMVRIKALRIHSHETSQGPLVVKILVNQPSIGFEDVQDAQEPEVAQVVQLSEEDVRDGKPIPLRFVRFQSVSSVHVSISLPHELGRPEPDLLSQQLFVKSNQGGSDETRIDELDFFGSLAQSYGNPHTSDIVRALNSDYTVRLVISAACGSRNDCSLVRCT